MAVTVNLRHLEAHRVQLDGELSAPELDLGLRDEVIRAEKPLCYKLEAQKLENAVLVQGSLRLTLQCECVRCLKPFDYLLELKEWTRHLPLAGEERVTPVNDSVDLTPYLREDILLELPQHPLCDADCGGLPGVDQGKARKTSDIHPAKQEVSAWAELDKLKL